MNEAVKTLLEIAEKEVGTREGALNNTGKRIREYQAATWLKPGAWPWCAAFTCWALSEALKHSHVLDIFGDNLKSPGMTQQEANNYRCKDASAFGWEKWATKNGFALLSEKKLAKAGDFVVFDFSHIGIVAKDQAKLSDMIETIEGNTNGKGERDSATGDGVWRKKRDHALTRHYIRVFS